MVPDGDGIRIVARTDHRPVAPPTARTALTDPLAPLRPPARCSASARPGRADRGLPRGGAARSRRLAAAPTGSARDPDRPLDHPRRPPTSSTRQARGARAGAMTAITAHQRVRPLETGDAAARQPAGSTIGPSSAAAQPGAPRRVHARRSRRASGPMAGRRPVPGLCSRPRGGRRRSSRAAPWRSSTTARAVDPIEKLGVMFRGSARVVDIDGDRAIRGPRHRRRSPRGTGSTPPRPRRRSTHEQRPRSSSSPAPIVLASLAWVAAVPSRPSRHLAPDVGRRPRAHRATPSSPRRGRSSRRRDRPDRAAELGVGVGVGAIWLVATHIGHAVLCRLFPSFVDQVRTSTASVVDDPPSRVLGPIVAMAVAEELLFRGVIQGLAAAARVRRGRRRLHRRAVRRTEVGARLWPRCSAASCGAACSRSPEVSSPRSSPTPSGPWPSRSSGRFGAAVTGRSERRATASAAVRAARA